MLDGHLLGRPAVERHDARDAGHDTALRRGFDVGDAVGARDRKEFGIRVDGDPGLDVRSEVTYFSGVLGGADGFDFAQGQGRCPKR